MDVTGIRGRPRRLAVGVAVALALALAVAGAAALLMRAHANGAAAAANAASQRAGNSVSRSLVSAPAVSRVAASGDTAVAVGSQDSAILFNGHRPDIPAGSRVSLLKREATPVRRE